MTSTALLLLTVTLAVAVSDWLAVASERKGLEYLAKPLTMVLLIGVAVRLDAPDAAVVGAFVVALVFSLLGDVLLMLPGSQWFVFGLSAFFAAHVAYIVGLVMSGVSLGALLIGLVIVVIAVLTIGLRIVRGVRESEDASLTGPVIAYLVVISLMVTTAIGTRNPFAIVGAVFFYSSDALIAWTRFVRPQRWGPVVIMVTYHLGQMGLVLSLV